MALHHILVSQDSIGDEASLEAISAGRATLSVQPLGTPQRIGELTAAADAIIVALQPLRRGEIQAFSERTSLIGRAGVGLDTIDLEAASGRGITVIHEPSYATAEVADHAVALLLGLARQIVRADRDLRSGWVTSVGLGRVPELGECTLGVIGLGRIGRAFVTRMRPFVRKILGFDPEATAMPDGVTAAENLLSLLSESDLVSLHVPLTADNRHLIGREELAAMPPGSQLINVSRGGLIDEEALATMLASGHLSGAAVDVFAEEPLPMGSPLRRAPNLILTPHIAGYSEGSAGRLARWMLEDVIAHLNGQALINGRYAVRP